MQPDKGRDEQRKYILCGADLAMGKRCKSASSKAVKIDEMYGRDGGTQVVMGTQVVYGEHNHILHLTAVDNPADQFIAGGPVPRGCVYELIRVTTGTLNLK